MIKKFPDFPDFRPNISPYEMFSLGIMGGCYFRDIKSPLTQKKYTKRYNKYQFLIKIPKEKYSLQDYDNKINKYQVTVGSSYEYWMERKWINEKIDPYGWIEWYINFYNGRRTSDDIRQIKRWKNIAGENGRFRKQLQNKINKLKRNDNLQYPKIRQTLLHWAFDTRKMKVKN